MTIDNGLYIDNLDSTAQSEVEEHLMGLWRRRWSLYEFSAMTIMLDARPDFAKLHRWGARQFGKPDQENILVGGLGNLYAYFHLGWEDGVLNEFRHHQSLGVTKAQLMEMVMFGQISAGIRGLRVVHNAVAALLPEWVDKDVKTPWPAGWAADPDAFKAGLDMSTHELTDQDIPAILAWYEKTIGYVPRSVSFAAKQKPAFLKAYRAKWENAFITMPKQLAPYLMLRQQTINGNAEAVREAALLGKAWGMNKEWVVKAVTQSAFYFSTLESLSVVDEGIGDILDAWDDGK